MTAYITITDPQTDPDAPLTSELAKQWRDNPIAMFEGVVGAPRLRLGALQRLVAGTTTRYSRSVTSTPSAAGSELLSAPHFLRFMQAGIVRH